MESLKNRVARFGYLNFVILCALSLGLSLAASGIAFADEDLSDNDVCLECHEDGEVTGKLKPEGVEPVHDTAGTHVIEAHDMWSCTECHMDITEIPHREDVERSVDCLMCHEEMPK